MHNYYVCFCICYLIVVCLIIWFILCLFSFFDFFSFFYFFIFIFFFFFSSRRRHTRFDCDWSSDVCSSDLHGLVEILVTLRDKWKKPLEMRLFVDGKRKPGDDTRTEKLSGIDLFYGLEIGRASCRERV